MQDNLRQLYVEWLNSEIDLWDRYHDHKETMAWTATALYLPGVIALGYTFNRVQQGLWANLGISVLILLVAWLAYIFVNMQFSMRWLAADWGAGLRRAMARLCGSDDLPTQAERGVDDGQVWPQFIQKEIEQSSQERRTCKAALEAFKLLAGC